MTHEATDDRETTSHPHNKTQTSLRCLHALGCCRDTFRTRVFGWSNPWRKTVMLQRLRVGKLCPAAVIRRSTFFTSSHIPNKGSMARDCLAAERTFLAWARTGLGFVGAGTAVFATWQDDRAPLLLMGNGAFLLAFATRRYFRVIQALQSTMFPLETEKTIAAVAVTALGTIAAAGSVAQAERKQYTLMSGETAETGCPSEARESK